MTTRRRRWLVGGAVALAGVAVLVGLDPSRRVLGLVAGEPFYRWRPASAWRRDLTGGNEAKVSAAVVALGESRGRAVPVCEWLLADPDPAVRRPAVQALGGMRADAAPAGPALVAALSDPDPLVRKSAVEAVGAVQPDPETAVPILVGLFPDLDALLAVGEYGPRAVAAVPRLLDLLRDPNERVRWRAVKVLQKTGGLGVADLRGLLRADPGSPVREQAAQALGGLGAAAAEAVPELTKGLADEAFGVRRASAWALGRVGPAARPTLEPLRGLAADPNRAVQAAAAEAVKRIGGESK